MSSVHFAYSVPRGSLASRLYNRFALASDLVPPLYRGGTHVRWGDPTRAPHSISRALLEAYTRRSDVRFYSMYEHGRAELQRGDIFIGSPVPDGHFSTQGRSSTDDVLSVTSRSIRESSAGKKFLIMPFANDESYVGWARDIVRDADGAILIGGEVWRRDLSHTPLGDLSGPRFLGVNMAINAESYPVVKLRFNPPRKRRFLYVGHTGWYKNTAELERLAGAIPGFEGGHIGIGTIPGWKKISDFASLTPERMSAIAQEYDIFLNTSTADPQATTVLEHMCWGFAIACTPQSGYEYDSITRLSPGDTAYNVERLHELQHAPENELLTKARTNRQYAVEFHNWKDFQEKILAFTYGFKKES